MSSSTTTTLSVSLDKSRMVTVASDDRKLLSGAFIKDPGVEAARSIMADESGKFMVVGDEKICESGSEHYVIPLGLGWNDGKRVPYLVIGGVILEYQKCIGILGLSPFTYGHAYVCAGIPNSYYSWIKRELADIGFYLHKNMEGSTATHTFVGVGVKLNCGPLDFTQSTDITGSHIVDALRSTKKSLVGTAVISANLTRTGGTGNNGLLRKLTLDIRSFDMSGTTDEVMTLSEASTVATKD